MEKITLNRKDLYEMVWSAPLSEHCNIYDIDVDGLETVCRRMNIPIPEKSHWKRLAQSKKTNIVPIPERSKGIDSVTLYKRDDEVWQKEQVRLIKLTLNKIDPASKELPDQDYSFDPLIISTREGIVKDREGRAKYYEKNKLLAVHVSSEILARALQVMDLLIKMLKFKGHQLIVDQRQTFVVIDGEKIPISLNEKSRSVEYVDEHNRRLKENHPAGILFFKKEGHSYHSRTWGEGPKKGSLEINILAVVDDLVEIARIQKAEHERWEQQRLEQQEKDRLRQERLEKQKKELAEFRGLMLGGHRVALAKMMREYIDAMEAQAIARDKLTDDLKQWITWARKKADWYDPTVATEEDELLKDVDVDNLRPSETYSGFGYGSYGNAQRENNFWKPWWS